MISPTRKRVSQELRARKSARSSALQPRVPRWVSETKIARWCCGSLPEGREVARCCWRSGRIDCVAIRSRHNTVSLTQAPFSRLPTSESPRTALGFACLLIAKVLLQCRNRFVKSGHIVATHKVSSWRDTAKTTANPALFLENGADPHLASPLRTMPYCCGATDFPVCRTALP